MSAHWFPTVTDFCPADRLASDPKCAPRAGLTVRVRMLGPFGVYGPNGWEPGPSLSRGGLLLRMLACASSRIVPIAEVKRTLPDGLTHGAQLHRVHMIASGARCYLRRLLSGFDPIRSTRNGYLLHGEVCIDSDFDAFNRAFDVGTIEALCHAEELFGGEFLSGETGEWIFRMRADLAGKYAHTLEHLATYNYERHRPDRAIHFAALLSGTDRSHEGAVRLIMRSYAALGLRTAALAEFESLSQFLNLHLGARPAPETRELYYALAQGD